MLIQYSMDSLDYYAGMYGTTPDEYAVMYGYTDANAYATEEAHYYLDTIMLVDKIIKDKKISCPLLIFQHGSTTCLLTFRTDRHINLRFFFILFLKFFYLLF